MSVRSFCAAPHNLPPNTPIPAWHGVRPGVRPRVWPRFSSCFSARSC